MSYPSQPPPPGVSPSTAIEMGMSDYIHRPTQAGSADHQPSTPAPPTRSPAHQPATSSPLSSYTGYRPPPGPSQALSYDQPQPTWSHHTEQANYIHRPTQSAGSAHQPATPSPLSSSPQSYHQRQPSTQSYHEPQPTWSHRTEQPSIVIQKAPHQRPPFFSGSTPVKQGEMDFETWARFVRRNLRDDETYPISLVRNSLRDHAQMQTEGCSQIQQIIDTLAEIHGTAEDKPKLLNEFYCSKQGSQESIKDFYIRILSLKTRLLDTDITLTAQLHDSVRQVFWNGLHSEGLKSTLHYKYDSRCPVAELMKALVNEEQAKKRSRSSSTVRQSQLVDAVSNLHITDKPQPQKSVRFDCPEGYIQVCSACRCTGHPAMTCPNKKANHPSRGGGAQRGWQSSKYRRFNGGNHQNNTSWNRGHRGQQPPQTQQPAFHQPPPPSHPHIFPPQPPSLHQMPPHQSFQAPNYQPVYQHQPNLNGPAPLPGGGQ